jgi:hypothetical protein
MSNFVRTYKRRKAFLDQLAVGSSVSFAAHAAGGSTSNFKRWRESDPEFAKDWDDAIEEGTDFIEDAATDRALKKSDALMAMILKARRPDKYDRASGKSVEVNINVEGAKAKLLNRIARLQASGELSTDGGETGAEASGAEPEETTPITDERKLLPAPRNEGVPIKGRKRKGVEPGDRRSAAA